MSDWVSDVCSSSEEDSRMNLPSQATANPGGRSNAMAAFAAVTVLFFAWGFITSLIDPLVAAVKGIFTLSDAEAQLSASAFFIAYGLMSFPAAALIARFHSVPSILTALSTMVVGCQIGRATVRTFRSRWP